MLLLTSRRPWMKGILENHPLFLSVFASVAGVAFCAWARPAPQTKPFLSRPALCRPSTLNAAGRSVMVHSIAAVRALEKERPAGHGRRRGASDPPSQNGVLSRRPSTPPSTP